MRDAVVIGPAVWLVTPRPRTAESLLDRDLTGEPTIHIERDETGAIVAVYEAHRVRYRSPEEALAVVAEAERRGQRVRR